MKKLALVLGSLLVVGTAASAKEVVPAPVVVPERVVEVVEKPVIVYRDRMVEAPAKWRPNGSVNVETRFSGEVEGHKADEKDWNGNSPKMQLRTTSEINFTEKQSLKLHTRDMFGLTRKNTGEKNDITKHEYIELTHTYNFGNLGSSKVNASVETMFSTEDVKHIQVKPVFDFSEYFFKNDYVKATALQLAPVYAYGWDRNDEFGNRYALYANAEFELPYGVTFQAEFDNLFSYDKANETEFNKGTDLTSKTGKVEMTLGKSFELYKNDKHTLKLGLEGVYETYWSYSKSDKASIDEAGTRRENGKTERWGSYTAKFEPSLNYSFQATEFVKLYARVAGEYKNRTEDRHEAKHWRWQPTARLGFTTSF